MIPRSSLFAYAEAGPKRSVLAAEHQPDLILFNWTGDSDVPVLHELHQRSPESGIVLLVSPPATEPICHPPDLGIRAILSSSASPETFKQCLLVAARDRMPASSLAGPHRRRIPTVVKAASRAQ